MHSSKIVCRANAWEHTRHLVVFGFALGPSRLALQVRWLEWLWKGVLRSTGAAHVCVGSVGKLQHWPSQKSVAFWVEYLSSKG